MLLLALLLFSGLLKLEPIEEAADGLLRHLILLFVPSAVGGMVYAESISGAADDSYRCWNLGNHWRHSTGDSVCRYHDRDLWRNGRTGSTQAVPRQI